MPTTVDDLIRLLRAWPVTPERIQKVKRHAKQNKIPWENVQARLTNDELDHARKSKA